MLVPWIAGGLMKLKSFLIIFIPTDTISSVVKILKGGTSKIIRKEFPDLEEFLWGDNFWACGFFAETVGRVNYADVKKYIQNQNITA